MPPKKENYLMHIELKNISHSFQLETGSLPVLKDLSLSVPRRKFVSIVGPSGCGKSTITRLVSGLLKPDPTEHEYAQAQRPQKKPLILPHGLQ